MNAARWGVMRLLIFLSGLSLAAIACGTEAVRPAITLHDLQNESQWVNNAIVEFILENGYGYPVETVVANTPTMMERLPAGELDVNLEGWQQNIIEWYNKEIGEGNIVNLGTIYEESSQVFVIPGWVAREHGIRTVADMKDHWGLFTDPNDPSKGAFFNCISGWECAEINTVKLQAYGLTERYNLVSPASAVAFESVFEEAAQQDRPVFGFYWTPTPLMASHDWFALEEPAYTGECWARVTAAAVDETLRPIDEACAYESLPIDILASSGLREKAPEVVDMLERMLVGLDPLNETMAWAVSNGVEDWQEAAVYYLQNNGDRWETWVTPEASRKIKEALEDTAAD